MVAGLVAKAGIGGGDNDRHKQQCCSSLHAYFTRDEHDLLIGETADAKTKLRVIMNRATALGMRTISEHSYQVIAGVYILASEGESGDEIRFMSGFF